MKFATLTTIHNLLVDEHHKAKLLEEMHRTNYLDALDAKEEQLGSRAKAEKALQDSAVYDRYQNSKRHYDEVLSALREFDDHEWR